MRIGRRLGIATRIVGFAAFVAFSASPNPSPAQIPGAIKVYPDSSHTADTLLRNADNMAKNGQFPSALDIYQRVITQFGDKVVEIPADRPAADPSEESHLFASARSACQRRIAALPPEARALYRSRVDGQAKRWYDQGRAERDKSLLRRVVEEAFCSSWGDDALELLGDLAFQEGKFAEAYPCYVRLSPLEPGSTGALSHPDPSVDQARVAAKALLTRAAMGPLSPTKTELEAFAKRFPNAKGNLAGRDDQPYAEIVADVLAKDSITAVPTTDMRWPTFAGSPTRNRVAAGSLDIGSKQWEVDLEPSTAPTRTPSSRFRGFGRGPQFENLAPPPPERRLAYHPIIVGEQVILCNAKEAYAYDLTLRPQTPGSTATPAKPLWHQEINEGVTATNRAFLTVARYTMTAYGDKIYARMGPSPVLSSSNFAGRGNFGMAQTVHNESVIVALDRKTDGKLLWRKFPTDLTLPDRKIEPEDNRLVFDGSPVVDAEGVYVPVSDRMEMTKLYVACLDPNTGATKWVRYVCEANANVDRFRDGAATELSYRLLTLDGPNLYFQTNLGAVAALDTQDGSIKWLATYPWEGKATTGQERDLNPAVAADGLVIVAPDDAPAIFAYDAMSGRLAWKTKNFPEEVKLTHLLGVAKGRVIATGNRVYLFDVKNGELLRTWPDSGQSPDAFGRGVLSGDKIYWPTKTEIHVLDQSTGLRTEPPIKLQETFGTGGGNLAVGDGYLLIAQEDKLVVFCQNSRLIERLREEIVRAPGQAINHYRLAVAAESSGLTDLAKQHLEETIAKAKPGETVDGRPLVEKVREHQYKIHIQVGSAARVKEDWDLAEKSFTKALTIAHEPRPRLRAGLDLADAQERGGKSKDAVTTLQTLLRDPSLRSEQVDDLDGRRSLRADLHLVDRLTAIMKKHGREPFAAHDREAAETAAKLKRDKEPRLLEELARLVPLAASVPDSLLSAAELYESQGRTADAARVYRRLEAMDTPPDIEMKALLGLGRSYETAGLFLPARTAYLQARAKFPDARLREGGTDRRLTEFVDGRLASKSFERIGGPIQPTVEVPLVRVGRGGWDDPRRFLTPDGEPPSNEACRLFLVDGMKLSPVDSSKGQGGWTFDKIDPVWVGYLSDKLIVGGRGKLVALSPARGNVIWEFHPRSGEGRAAPNPFDQADADGSEVPTGFHEFKIVDGRIVFLRGDQELLAVDGESGQIDWTFAPLLGHINPNWLVTPTRIAFQVTEPSSLVVLDTATGRKRIEKPLEANVDWKRPPVPLDEDKAAVVTDLKTVTLLDLDKAGEVWHFRESQEVPTYGAPRVFVEGRNLLVLHDGRWLISLDPRTGSKRWDRMISDKDLSERPEATRLGSDRFFHVTGNTLNALRLDDGRPAWSKPLIGLTSGWAVGLTAGQVVAYPNLARIPDADQASWPIVIRSRDDGRLIQRLLIPVNPSDVRSRRSSSDLIVQLAPKATLIATRSGLWSLIERSP